ncbi:hypothetical protein [Paenibacillus fonticola]|uniref:hypothetical protein n=1 Tax=Paenibacillus fonticola TaxID=379896 RepID=UPI00036F517E|nr:hypothetical protein [Paenibacillus fonticola]
MLAKWLSDPLVLEYYEGRDNSFDLEKVNKKFYQRKNGVIGCIVEFENVEIGYIQFYQLDNETRKLYGYVKFARWVPIPSAAVKVHRSLTTFVP